MRASEIATRLNLTRRPEGRGWVGECPSCRYENGFTLRERDGKAMWWCASCGDDREALTRAVLGDQGHVGDGERRTGLSDAATRTRRAMHFWDQALPIAGSIAERYLATRRLTQPDSGVLRFLPDAPHPAGTRCNAMVALAVDGAGRGQAIHRTFLAPGGAGKAQLDPPRATLGPIGGAVVRLCRWREGQPLVIGEGIETSLSASLLTGHPAWAAISAGNMKAVQLPDAVTHVLVAADHDMPGQRAAWAAADAFMAQGRQVRILTPDNPGEDFNDVLMRQSAKEAAHA